MNKKHVFHVSLESEFIFFLLSVGFKTGDSRFSEGCWAQRTESFIIKHHWGAERAVCSRNRRAACRSLFPQIHVSPSVINDLLTAACFDSVASTVLTDAQLNWTFQPSALFFFHLLMSAWRSSAHQTALAPKSLFYFERCINQLCTCRSTLNNKKDTWHVHTPQLGLWWFEEEKKKS